MFTSRRRARPASAPFTPSHSACVTARGARAKDTPPSPPPKKHTHAPSHPLSSPPSIPISISPGDLGRSHRGRLDGRQAGGRARAGVDPPRRARRRAVRGLGQADRARQRVRVRVGGRDEGQDARVAAAALFLLLFVVGIGEGGGMGERGRVSECECECFGCSPDHLRRHCRPGLCGVRAGPPGPGREGSQPARSSLRARDFSLPFFLSLSLCLSLKTLSKLTSCTNLTASAQQASEACVACRCGRGCERGHGVCVSAA